MAARKKIILAAITALLVSLTLTACSDLSLVKLTKNDAGLLENKSAGLTYTYAPTSIEPVSVGEPYAIYKTKKSEMTLYEIPGLEPERWLCEEYSGMATVFHSPDIAIPTLAEFAPDLFYICVSDAITISVATVEEADVISALVDAYMNGADADYPLIDSRAYYQLKFVSDDYEGIYYNLTFAVFDEGSFLYDRATKRCVAIDGLLDAYIENNTLGVE